MTGMFSLLDVLFGTELEKVLTPLHLEDDVLNALMHRGLLGECLQIAVHADRRWNPHIAQLLQQRELDSTAYYESVQSAFQWVNQVCKEL
jgi:c-di-GMP-related signal transduction protein